MAKKKAPKKTPETPTQQKPIPQLGGKELPTIQGLTVALCELAAGPAMSWVSRCHEISDLVNRGLGLGLYLAYGAYRGPIHKDSQLYRAGCPWGRHGWLQTYDDTDETIVDVTRWVFEHVAPYVYVGPNRKRGLIVTEYDVGNDFSRLAREEYLSPPDSVSQKPCPLNIAAEHQPTLKFIWDLFECVPRRLNLGQVAYLANLSRYTLGAHARVVFQAIVDAGQKMLIPTDNYQYVFRRRPLLGPGSALEQSLSEGGHG